MCHVCTLFLLNLQRIWLEWFCIVFQLQVGGRSAASLQAPILCLLLLLDRAQGQFTWEVQNGTVDLFVEAAAFKDAKVKEHLGAHGTRIKKPVQARV